MEAHKNIVVKGAREHNLKNIDIILPRDKMIVVSGVSGSGKSSLAFDTIYAEGQRRYVESLSSYARQFLGLMEKPDIDYIEGLSPAISIEQKTTHKNPRSTVATITEIYDYLRLLFARVGTPYCHKCGKVVESMGIDQIVELVLSKTEGTKIMVMAPVIRGKKGEHLKVFEDAGKSGFTKVNVNGKMYSLEDDIKLERNKKHNIDIVVDRLVIKDGIRQRLSDSVETALSLTSGIVSIDYDGVSEIYSENFSCVDCGISYPEIQPRLFSFNNPQGACAECHGLGEINEFDLKKIIPDRSLSLNQGAILTHLPRHNVVFSSIKALANHFNFSLDTPFNELGDDIVNILLYGSNEDIDFRYESKGKTGVWEYKSKFKGIVNDLKRRFKESASGGVRDWLESFMTVQECKTCKGKRLNETALSVKISGKNINDITKMRKVIFF